MRDALSTDNIPFDLSEGRQNLFQITHGKRAVQSMKAELRQRLEERDLLLKVKCFKTPKLSFLGRRQVLYCHL